MAKSNSWIIFDGQLHSSEQPIAKANSRGLMYGEGVFETLRVYQGHTLLLKEHINRLKKGLTILGMAASGFPSLAEVGNKISLLLQKQALLNTDAIVRMQCWQEGNRGYCPEAQGNLRYLISASKCPADFEFPTLATVNICRIPSNALPSGGKFTNGLNYILAAKEAAEKGADDALMQTVEGWISETTIANLFWIQDNDIYTPSAECDLLPGITRQLVMDIAKTHQSVQVTRGKYRLEALAGAEAVIMCNSVRELLPVRKIDEQDYDPDHPFVEELQKLFSNYRDQNLKALPTIP